MPKKQDSAARIRELESEVARLKGVNERTFNLWREETHKSASGFANQMDLARSRKQLLIIGHIAAGRPTEAISELLTALPFAIEAKVVYADDQSRLAAEAELLERLKRLVMDALNKVALVTANDKGKEGE